MDKKEFTVSEVIDAIGISKHTWVVFVLLAFAMSMDDVIISVFVTGVGTNTLPVKIYSQLKTGVTPEINALCTLLFVATLLLCGLAALLGRAPKKRKSERM